MNEYDVICQLIESGTMFLALVVGLYILCKTFSDLDKTAEENDRLTEINEFLGTENERLQDTIDLIRGDNID